MTRTPPFRPSALLPALAFGLAACGGDAPTVVEDRITATAGDSTPPAAQRGPTTMVSAILQDGPGTADATARAILAEHAPRAALDSLTVLEGVRAFSIPLTAAEAAAVTGDWRVALAEEAKEATVESATTSWALDRLDQRALPLDGAMQLRGDGGRVYVYVFDTGTRGDHQDFGGRVARGANLVTGSPPGAPGNTDCHGHGTLVASAAAGGTWGSARRALIIPLAIMNCRGQGTSTDFLRGVDFMIRQRRANPAIPMVANFSLGFRGGSLVADDAIARAIAEGITVVAAAGNDATDACTVSPARVPGALTVGASDRNDRLATFTNAGSCVDLFAPGVAVTNASNHATTSVVPWSGTSAAAPFVAGLVALYLDQFPSATPAQVHAAFVNGATEGALTGMRGTGTPNRLVYGGVTGTPAASDSATAPSGPPSAVATVQCVRRSCSFDGRASVVRQAGATWRWRFSTGDTASGPTVSRAFTTNGTVTAELTVRDAAGQQATTTVVANVVDAAPVARVTGRCVRLSCSASAATSSDDGRIVAYRWEWNDGSVVTGASSAANRTFTQPGQYTVRVTVTDDAGQTSTASATVTATPPPPTVRFTVACNGRLCTFDGSATSDPAGPIARYEWIFGDGTTGSGVRAQRRYATAGTYTVLLWATGATGATGEARVTLTVR